MATQKRPFPYGFRVENGRNGDVFECRLGYHIDLSELRVGWVTASADLAFDGW
jgi:hypothetical protein